VILLQIISVNNMLQLSRFVYCLYTVLCFNRLWQQQHLNSRTHFTGFKIVIAHIAKWF